MINLDSITNKNNKEHNKKWPYIQNLLIIRILIISGSRSGKTSTLINLKNSKIMMILLTRFICMQKDLSKSKYKFLIKSAKKLE